MQRHRPEYVVAWARPQLSDIDDPLLDDHSRARLARLARVDDRARHATGRILALREAARVLDVDPSRLVIAATAQAPGGPGGVTHATGEAASMEVDEGDPARLFRMLTDPAMTAVTTSAELDPPATTGPHTDAATRAPGDPRPRAAGRPLLRLDGRECRLHLSIAHDGEAVVAALADRPIGVDVTAIATLASRPDLLASRTVFTRGELRALARLPESERLERAARWWTGKEAAVKALGCGFVVDPAEIDARRTRVIVPPSPRRPARERLRLLPLAAPPGYVATLGYARG